MRVKKKSNHKVTAHPNDAQRLRIVRKIQGLSQREFADRLEVSASSYRGYELGRQVTPLFLRRAIWKWTGDDVLPLDPMEDPRLLLKKHDAPVVKECVQHTAWSYLRACREEYRSKRLHDFSRARRVWAAVRDYTFLIALFYITMKLLSIRLNFPFGAPSDRLDVVLLGAVAIVVALSAATFQDLSFRPKRA